MNFDLGALRYDADHGQQFSATPSNAPKLSRSRERFVSSNGVFGGGLAALSFAKANRLTPIIAAPSSA